MRNRPHAGWHIRMTSCLLVCCILAALCTQVLAAGVDKNILVYALQEAQTAMEDGSADAAIPAVKEELEAAIENGQIILEKEDATRQDVQDAYLQLQNALWKLSYVQADKEALKQLVKSAEALDLSVYDQTEAAAVAEALAEAKALLEDENLSTADQELLDNAYKKLQKALNSLTQENPVLPSTPQGNKPADQPKITFRDVPEDVWYADGVQATVKAGLMNGTGNDCFSPDASMTRAMLITVLYRQAGAPAQSGSHDTWYDAAITWAKSVGLSDGTNPMGSVTREQVATLLYRYCGASHRDENLHGYADGAKVSAWARPAMGWATANGILTGKPGMLLDPQGTATRAEIAVILMRYLEYLQH